MFEMHKFVIHQAHQGWTPILVVVMSHNYPSLEQRLIGYSFGALKVVPSIKSI
jgi:hypothetical protein